MYLPNLLILLSQVSCILYSPEQVHISFGNSDSELFVTWTAQYKTPSSILQYNFVKHDEDSSTNFSNTVQGTWRSFPNLNGTDVLQRTLYSCSVIMTNLIPGGFYKYRVGSDVYGWSKNFTLEAKKDHRSDHLARILVYGDFGINSETEFTIDALSSEVSDYKYDAIIHNGDFAYDLSSESGSTGDKFMNYIQKLASKIPYMVSQGNHEGNKNVLHYTNRFMMPGNSSNFYYSFNIGKAHFISYSTEFIFEEKQQEQNAQMEFLINDLTSLDRTKYPWVVVFGHRPLYCSPDYSDHDDYTDFNYRKNKDCAQDSEKVRKVFEPIWYQYQVDLVIQAHVHSYERLSAVYQNASVPCQVEDINQCKGAKAPVYIVTGAPGQSESHAPVSQTPSAYSKMQDDSWGYSRLTVHNSTHLLWEQVRSKTKKVSDTFWLIK